MVSLFLLLGCNLSYIVDLFAALHELASASVRTLLACVAGGIVSAHEIKFSRQSRQASGEAARRMGRGTLRAAKPR